MADSFASEDVVEEEGILDSNLFNGEDEDEHVRPFEHIVIL